MGSSVTKPAVACGALPFRDRAFLLRGWGGRIIRASGIWLASTLLGVCFGREGSLARQASLRSLARGLVLVLGVAAALGGARSAAAQGTTTIIHLESPSSTAASSTRMMVSGWAADPSGRGTGVDIVEIYLGDPQADGMDLGAATYGQPRPDVARTLGDPRFDRLDVCG